MISKVLRFLSSPAGRALIALGLVILLGLVFHADGAFYKFGTHRDTIRQASVCGILACGMTLVIITAGIDLAVGSILGLTGVCFALMTIHWGWPAWQAIPAALAAGALCGAFSGALIAGANIQYLAGLSVFAFAVARMSLHWGWPVWQAVPAALVVAAACGAAAGILTAGAKIQPFIATLAMMVFARGLAKWASEGKKISQAVTDPDGSIRFVDIPKIFEWIDSRLLGGTVSGVTIVFLVCVAITWILLARHRWGRELYAIGGNEEAARLSGVPVVRAKTMAYLVSGLLAAVAGICHAAQARQGDPEAGATYELTAIAMVVIGGTSLMGGRGGVGLTLLGTLTIGYLDKILSINAVEESGRLMLTGAIIVIAVLTQRRR